MGSGNSSLWATTRTLPSLSKVGIVGLFNLGLLTMISLWRTVVLVRSASPKDWYVGSFRKKLLLHVLLFMATATDLPMYVSFIVVGEYSVGTYAFHKWECAYIFTAYSITITDWSAVLYEINEDSHTPFLLKRGIVWFVTISVIAIALLNFVFCLAMNNLNTYTQTPIYIMGIVVQMGASFLLTCVMLQGGIKLAWRIRGASGHVGRNSSMLSNLGKSFCYLAMCCGALATARNRRGNTNNDALLLVNAEDGGVSSSSPVKAGAHQLSADSNGGASLSGDRGSGGGLTGGASLSIDGRSQEFLSALRTLNMVMATCASCEFIQMTLLFFNWMLGFAGSQSQTVGPVYFYWTFYAWAPLWGVILSLLYLSSSRNSSSLRKRGGDAAGNNNNIINNVIDNNNNNDLTRRLVEDDEQERALAIKLASQHSEVASSPGSSFNSSTYSYTRPGSVSVSYLPNDVFSSTPDYSYRATSVHSHSHVNAIGSLQP
jgi:hypothetical protein